MAYLIGIGDTASKEALKLAIARDALKKAKAAQVAQQQGVTFTSNGTPVSEGIKPLHIVGGIAVIGLIYVAVRGT